jgi:hypothetical protein
VEDVGEVLEAARDAYRRHDWAAARERFTAARSAGELDADDLDALGDAAWWLGETDEASAVMEAAYHRHLDQGRPGPAAMAALGIAVTHLLRGSAPSGAAGSAGPSGCSMTNQRAWSTDTCSAWTWRPRSAAATPAPWSGRGAVHRHLPGPPLPGPAAPGCLGPGRAGGGPGLPGPRRAPGRRRRRGPLPGRGDPPAAGATWPEPRWPTGTPTGSAATPSPAWPCSGSPRAGPRRRRPPCGPP